MEFLVPRKQYNPLDCIPSAAAIREHLEQVEEEARRLRVVLKTAERIEKKKSRDTVSKEPSK